MSHNVRHVRSCKMRLPPPPKLHKKAHCSHSIQDPLDLLTLIQTIFAKLGLPKPTSLGNRACQRRPLADSIQWIQQETWLSPIGSPVNKDAVENFTKLWNLPSNTWVKRCLITVKMSTLITKHPVFDLKNKHLLCILLSSLLSVSPTPDTFIHALDDLIVFADHILPKHSSTTHSATTNDSQALAVVPFSAQRTLWNAQEQDEFFERIFFYLCSMLSSPPSPDDDRIEEVEDRFLSNTLTSSSLITDAQTLAVIPYATRPIDSLEERLDPLESILFNFLSVIEEIMNSPDSEVVQREFWNRFRFMEYTKIMQDPSHPFHDPYVWRCKATFDLDEDEDPPLLTPLMCFGSLSMPYFIGSYVKDWDTHQKIFREFKICKEDILPNKFEEFLKEIILDMTVHLIVVYLFTLKLSYGYGGWHIDDFDDVLRSYDPYLVHRPFIESIFVKQGISLHPSLIETAFTQKGRQRIAELLTHKESDLVLVIRKGLETLRKGEIFNLSPENFRLPKLRKLFRPEDLNPNGPAIKVHQQQMLSMVQIYLSGIEDEYTKNKEHIKELMELNDYISTLDPDAFILDMEPADTQPPPSPALDKRALLTPNSQKAREDLLKELLQEEDHNSTVSALPRKGSKKPSKSSKKRRSNDAQTPLPQPSSHLLKSSSPPVPPLQSFLSEHTSSLLEQVQQLNSKLSDLKTHDRIKKRWESLIPETLSQHYPFIRSFTDSTPEGALIRYYKDCTEDQLIEAYRSHYLPGIERMIEDPGSPLYNDFSLPYRYHGHEGRVLFGRVEIPSLLLTRFEKNIGTHFLPVSVWIGVGADRIVFHKQYLPLLSQQGTYESPKGLMEQLDVILTAKEEAWGSSLSEWNVSTTSNVSFWYEEESHTIRMTIGTLTASQIHYTFSAVRRK